MALTKRGTFSKSYAKKMNSEKTSVQCFACKKKMDFDPNSEVEPTVCSGCGCKDLRKCSGGSCKICEQLKDK
jgi:Zn finger protein HypA/HybF involved in hydrogenase expression